MGDLINFNDIKNKVKQNGDFGLDLDNMNENDFFNKFDEMFENDDYSNIDSFSDFIAVSYFLRQIAEIYRNSFIESQDRKESIGNYINTIEKRLEISEKAVELLDKTSDEFSIFLEVFNEHISQRKKNKVFEEYQRLVKERRNNEDNNRA